MTIDEATSVVVGRYVLDVDTFCWAPNAEPKVSEIKQEIKQGALFSNGSIEVHNKEDWNRFINDVDKEV